jgi:penicillin-binding protein 1A
MKDEDIKATFLKPVKMKVFAWNAKREIDTVMTPRDSIKYHKQLLQTSFVSMDPKSGEVKCWVGGIDFKWFKFDHVTAKRQVGSTFKPLLYSIAVQDAGYTPETYIPGGPLTLGGKTISTGGGTMAYCLAKSLNGAAWHLMGTIGVKRTIEFATQCGIKTKLPPYPSIALGAAEIPMLEMLQGYTMFPNKGYNTEPVFMSRIEDKNGNVLQEFIPETKQVLNESDAYTMVTLMKGVVQFGTGRSLGSYNIPAEKAGKTGTTNDNTDGWFIGYTPELLAGTWVGCDDPFIRIYAGTSGGNEMALPKWGYFMNKVYADKKLPYGNKLKFEVPNDSINGIQYSYDLQRLANMGDSSQYEDQGNGNASDFDAPLTDYNSEVPLESATEPVIKDTATAKQKTEPPANPADKKDNKPATPAPAAMPE